MIKDILYLLRIGPGWNVRDMDGNPGKDFGPNWIHGFFFYLYRTLWCKDEYVRVEYFFEYVHYSELEKAVCVKLIDPEEDE
tara:strand:- start:178 stop:420 length:243 start_codon:yes stop_codon:yes gene_type:complete